MSELDEGPKTVSLALRELTETYNDLNPNVVDEVWEEPSALEFMQYVARNRPLIIRGGARSWTAIREWSAEYLIDAVGDSEVNVSITPHGNADSVLEIEDGSLSFVKPYERSETFRDLITYIQEQEKTAKTGPVRYGQTQNDNLRNEYERLFADVPATGPPFARIALRKTPEAINFWLGNSHSTTSLHKDNYENMYAQVRGRKHFVLLPPIAAAAVNEQGIKASTYVLRNEESEEGHGIGVGDLEVKADEGGDGEGDAVVVRWALWDPDSPDERATPYSALVQPLRVTLDEGDLLYLPALWYHKVGQSCGEEGFCCAVNYWYDMDFAGSFWAANAFVRDVVRAEVDK